MDRSAMPHSSAGQRTPPDRTVRPLQPSAEAQTAQQARHNDVESAVKKVNQVVQAAARDIEFSVDKASGETVVKVVDRATKQVIRQIPSEEMLAISQSIDKLQGLLVKQEV
jgi:flagellar protein FlaG